MTGDAWKTIAENAAGTVIGGAALAAGRPLWQAVAPFVAKLREQALPQAHARFEHNAATFVAAVTREVTRDVAAGPEAPAAAEARLNAAAEQLADPDVAWAFGDALRAAGRTDDADLHATLAKLVAARLNAETGSAAAVAANLAARTVESLGAVHLRTLALLALLHYVGRPNVMSNAYPRFPERPGASVHRAQLRTDPAYDAAAVEAASASYHEWARELDTLASAYAGGLVTRLVRGAERVGLPDEVSESVSVHLIAAGCAIRRESPPELYEALAHLIGPPAAPDASAADRARERAVESAYYEALFLAARRDATLVRLAAAWTTTLHRIALTPAGFLIGLAALDAIAEEEASAEWRWAGVAECALAPPPYTPATAVNKGWARDPAFQDVLGDALSDMAERRHLALRRVLDRR